MTTRQGRIGRLVEEARWLGTRDFLRRVFENFRSKGLLLYAASIAFRTAVASIPMLLFVLGIAGFLGLATSWDSEVGPRVAAAVSPAAFTIIDDTITQVLTEGRLFWVTLGAVIAIFQVSSAIHAVMHALNEVYETDEERTFLQQALTAALLAVATIVLVALAVAAVQGGPRLVTAVLGDGWLATAFAVVLSWAVALAALLTAVGLLLRAGPDRSRPLEWVTVGAVLVIGLWILMSLAMGAYVGYFGNPQSIFGALATVFVALEYLFFCALALLLGVQVDAVLRGERERG